jgi:hypothetical protein
VRGASSTIVPTIAGDTYVGVSIGADGRIAHRSSQQPFRYM